MRDYVAGLQAAHVSWSALIFANIVCGFVNDFWCAWDILRDTNLINLMQDFFIIPWVVYLIGFTNSFSNGLATFRTGKLNLSLTVFWGNNEHSKSWFIPRLGKKIKRIESVTLTLQAITVNVLKAQSTSVYFCYVNERKPWLLKFLGNEIHAKDSEKDF